MICIFCPANDLPALWAYQGLKRRGLLPLEIFTPEALVYNQRLEHRLQNGETLIQLTLQDERDLNGAAIRGVLNRISALPQEHLRAAAPADLLYAVQEQHAILLSWLHGLSCTLINPPGPRGLCGDFRSTAEWIWLAGKAGLPAIPFRQNSTTIACAPSSVAAATLQVIVLDGDIFGYPQTLKVLETFRVSLARLAGLSGLRLLGVEFQLGPDGELLFASATPMPDLRLGGEPLLDTLAGALL